VEERRRYAVPEGVVSFPPWEVRCYPPATAGQLEATEAALGFPLPAELRHFYAEVANGGLELGPLGVFYGAIGGCSAEAEFGGQGRTIEHFLSRESWQLHPRITAALLRHPSTYVLVDSCPTGFLTIGDVGCGISVDLQVRTGYLYHTAYWSEIPSGASDEVISHHLMSLELVAPSLEDWFTRWLDDPWGAKPGNSRRLVPDLVDTSELPDPRSVWRGLYQLGPDWDRLPPDDEHDDDPW
jgi:hypothetical protein